MSPKGPVECQKVFVTNLSRVVKENKKVFFFRSSTPPDKIKKEGLSQLFNIV